jgi:hypothetical protein
VVTLIERQRRRFEQANRVWGDLGGWIEVRRRNYLHLYSLSDLKLVKCGAVNIQGEILFMPHVVVIGPSVKT